jgi:hypothetical protein
MNNTLERITPNGEICRDTTTNEYVVFDETYSNELGRTVSKVCAQGMLDEYCDTCNLRYGGNNLELDEAISNFLENHTYFNFTTLLGTIKEGSSQNIVKILRGKGFTRSKIIIYGRRESWWYPKNTKKSEVLQGIKKVTLERLLTYPIRYLDDRQLELRELARLQAKYG